MPAPTGQSYQCTTRNGAPGAPSSGSRFRSGPYRLVRRVSIAVVGSIVLLAGLVLLVTPGPAFVVIPIGLGILALEFEWARRWLDTAKAQVAKVLPSHRRPASGD